jgi:hypothetical protein
MKIVGAISATLIAIAVSTTGANAQALTLGPGKPSASAATQSISPHIGSQKWGAWFTLKIASGESIKCRNYVSINSGSRIKYRGYTECKHRTYMTVFIAGTGGGHSRACRRTTWCDAVKYVNNKRGVQKWCAGASSAIATQTPDSRYDVRICIRY